jgi:hypothetical protein
MEPDPYTAENAIQNEDHQEDIKSNSLIISSNLHIFFFPNSMSDMHGAFLPHPAAAVPLS